MEKIVYLLWRRGGECAEALRERLLGDVAGTLTGPASRTTLRGLNIGVADLRDQLRGHEHKLMGEGARLGAVVSLWLDSLDHRAEIEAALAAVSSRLCGYSVTESVPQRCTDRDWSDGERSPGLTHFTCFPRPDRVSQSEFLAAWHGEQTPISFELHPRRWQYTRDTVARAITADALPLDAIVHERFRCLDDYLDPQRFFGSGDVVPRMLAIVRRFADLSQMHSVPLSEYILRSPSF